MYRFAILQRNKKGGVGKHLGSIYIKHRSNIFKLLSMFKEFEIYEVDMVLSGKEPEYMVKPKRGRICPYCHTTGEKWINKTHCPVCGVSVSDYHVKYVNDLWGSKK